MRSKGVAFSDKTEMTLPPPVPISLLAVARFDIGTGGYSEQPSAEGEWSYASPPVPLSLLAVARFDIGTGGYSEVSLRLRENGVTHPPQCRYLYSLSLASISVLGVTQRSAFG